MSDYWNVTGDMNRNSAGVSPPKTGPKGIGGWLIIPIFGTAVSLFLTGKNLYETTENWSGIQAILTGETADLASLRIPVLLSLIGAFAVIGLGLRGLYCIFTYSPKTVKAMTMYYVCLVVVTLVEDYLNHLIAEISNEAQGAPDFPRILIAAVLWTTYFWRSKRVANTFKTQEANLDNQIDKIFS